MNLGKYTSPVTAVFWGDEGGDGEFHWGTSGSCSRFYYTDNTASSAEAGFSDHRNSERGIVLLFLAVLPPVLQPTETKLNQKTTSTLEL